MSLLRAFFVPHVPTLLMEEEAAKEGTLIPALRVAGSKLQEEGVAVVVVATTHWQPAGPFRVDPAERHPTVIDYYGFPVVLHYDPPGDPDLARTLVAAGTQAGLSVEAGRHGADHGVTVPLHFLFPEANIPTVILSVSHRSFEECRTWGATVARTLENDPRPAALLVSGCLAHDLAAFQIGMDTDSQRFDAIVLSLLQSGRWDELFHIDPQLLDAGKPEGGLRDLAFLRGAMGEAARGNLAAYDGSLPGVGMAVLEFSPK